MPKLLNIKFFALLFKMVSEGIKSALFTIVASHSHKKSASFMPSDTILKVVQKGPSYIFVMKPLVQKSANFMPKGVIFKKGLQKTPI